MQGRGDKGLNLALLLSFRPNKPQFIADNQVIPMRGYPKKSSEAMCLSLSKPGSSWRLDCMLSGHSKYSKKAVDLLLVIATFAG